MLGRFEVKRNHYNQPHRGANYRRMRNISFMLTKEQIRNETKTVTRRNGWDFLKFGESLQPVEKAQGLKKGEKVKKLGPPIQVRDIRKERLDAITPADCALEGFPDMTPADFVAMYCKANKCKPETIVTRIEFFYLPPF